MKIDEINAPMLQRLFNKMISDGYTLATVKKSKFLLGQFFEYCMDNDFLKTNPVAKTRLASRESKVQTTEEYKAIPPELRKDFVKALDASPILKPICYTSLFAGLCIGEVLALRWRDVDFTEKTIWVDNAVTVIPHYDDAWRVSDYETVISDTKTAASVRSAHAPNSDRLSERTPQPKTENGVRNGHLLYGRRFRIQDWNRFFAILPFC